MSLSKSMKKRGKENQTMRRAAEAVVAEVVVAEAVVAEVVVAEAVVAEAVVAEVVCECENETNRRCRRRHYTVFLQVCVYNCNHIHDYCRCQNHHHRRIHYRKIRIFFLF